MEASKFGYTFLENLSVEDYVASKLFLILQLGLI